MKYHHHVPILTVMITISFALGAQEIYENVDQKGVVEFSDHPSPGAKEIEVKPNVVDVAPVKPLQPSRPASKAPASSMRPESIQENEAGGYYDYGDHQHRKLRREHQRRRELREDAARQSLRRELGRMPARPAGRGR